MSFQHTITRQWSGSNGTSQQASLQQTGSEEVNISINVAQNSTNQLVPCAFAVANCKSVFLMSDQDLTLKTNSSGSPTQTISVKAGHPIEWQYGDTAANPFTNDVTAFYVTTGAVGTAGANLEFRVLQA